MSKIAAIKRAINWHISPENPKRRSDLYVKYSNWYCGVTNDANVRKAQHINTKNVSALYFKSWDTGSKHNAIEIEKYFHSLKMKGNGGVGGVRNTSTHVYIFKIRPNFADEVANLLKIIE